MYERRKEFAEKLVPAAQAAQRKWKVPASVLVAQALVESRWGKSAPARERNNVFGVPKRKPRHYAEHLGVYELKRSFRAFASIEACFLAHARLIATSEAYLPAMKNASDPNFLIDLRDCGYSEDEDYPSKLWKWIKLFDLTQYDLKPEDAR